MLKFDSFKGINNVMPPERLEKSELVSALNVDISNNGQLLRRQGYAQVIAECHRNLWQGPAFKLCTLGAGELVSIVGTTETVVHEALGPDRVWYCRLPDGRVVFSNGLIGGITDGSTSHLIGVPLPDSGGTFTSIPGQLHPGLYQWALTHTRLSDGLEGGTTYGDAVDVQEGGILLTGLPVRDGYSTTVYLTGANGDTFFLAGLAVGGSFSYTGANDALSAPCHSLLLAPMPVGILPAFWRTRLLMAVGNTLVASQPNRWEIHDPAKDVKQFSARITLVQPVHDGLYVGTDEELAFLSGTTFDGLSFVRSIPGPVLLGSGVSVGADRIGEGATKGDAMICIANRLICAGMPGGAVNQMTEDRYEVDASITEVQAAFREVRGIPQYLATPA